MTKTKKPQAANAVESSELGETDSTSTKAASAEKTQAINDALGLQMISIRLPKSVIEDFKLIAQIEGIGYQPLMRTALIRFAECETKRVLRDYAAQREARKTAQAALSAPEKLPPTQAERKAA